MLGREMVGQEVQPIILDGLIVDGVLSVDTDDVIWVEVIERECSIHESIAIWCHHLEDVTWEVWWVGHQVINGDEWCAITR